MDSCEKCCETCEYSSYGEDQDNMCMNEQSEYFSDYVDNDHCCDEWSGREED